MLASLSFCARVSARGRALALALPLALTEALLAPKPGVARLGH